ncbi:hypothetical protein L198_03315 [Cryptococcus wingfieldii CBS 7118]|uniref:Uncharacterized protein n=1 Tax=Cryptococcus wingfieldii CBS 7118 TaxID=1295528 RepID=A0A1E3JHS7_9TREE|nr:hypothetical protein L198_03315 [Cryptococcus wingfieldii CBS 7118]ODN99471.1 hypothetical protein L198_03315 [Cryptococcus wingfieldii CBS 7118]
MVFPFRAKTANTPPPPPLATDNNMPPPHPSAIENHVSPSTGPPPRYTAVVRRVYPYTLRPIVIFVSIVGFIYGIALGVESIKGRNDDGETSKMKVFDIIEAIMFFVIAGTELFVLAVAIMQSLQLARLFIVLVPVGVLVNLAVSIVSIIVHFTLKSDLISQCVTNEEGDSFSDSWSGSSFNVTNTQANTICNNSWNRGTWGVFAWLLITLGISLLFASTYFSYYHQLLDPTSVRERQNYRQNQNQAFPMQSSYPPPPDGQQAWMVPPYPGPPAPPGHYANNPPPPAGYEKSDYHPGAEWAQGDYAPPAGAPPRERDIGENRAEEEAWDRARSQGVTAHLTGHGFAPRRSSDSLNGGYAIPNAEEDEAWERARNEGVTSHLTGNKRNGERDV